MKKIVTFLFAISFVMLSAQTKLTSNFLELKKLKDNYQILNAVNQESNQVFVFASDKKNVTALKYNSALFFTDSLNVNRPAATYDFMAGYSFEKEESPYVYWSTNDLKKILAVQYDFASKKTAESQYELPFKNEEIINSFSENNTFYILSKIHTQEKLKLYVFKNGKYDEHILDFATYDFDKDNKKEVKFSELLEENPIQKIETKTWNPLFSGVPKTKLYVLDNKILLTFDQSSERTQIFEIDLATFEIKEKNSPQSQLKDHNGLSNSYFYQDKLYQLKANKKEMVFTVKNYNSDEIIKTYSITANDTIAFKNSDLNIQRGRQRPRDLKTTEKFLDRLNGTNIGLSVYRTKIGTFITLGGIENVSSTGSVLLGITVGVGSIISGSYGSIGGGIIENDDVLQTIYFESLLDSKSEHIDREPQPLAVDFISGFLNDHDEVSLETTFRFKDFYILGYYDAKAKQYIMRKFQDGISY